MIATFLPTAPARYVVEAMDDSRPQNIDVAGRLYFYDNGKKEMALAPPAKAVRRY